jgi:hypothetical protein
VAATGATAAELPAAIQGDNTRAQAGALTGQPGKSSQNNLPIYAQEPPANGDSQAWGQKALRALSEDAGTAIAQAKGLLAFLSNAARAKRKAGERDDDDQFFHELSRSVDAAEQEMNSAINTAGQEILAGGSPDTSGLTITTVTMTQVTVDVSLSLNITA